MFSCTLVRVKGDAAAADEAILCCTAAAEQEGLGETKADADEAVARMVKRIDGDRVMIVLAVMLFSIQYAVMEEVLCSA